MVDIIDTIVEILKFWGNNLRTNLGNTFNGMTTERYIRMVAVVGAYLLLRPYIMKLGQKVQEKEHEKQMEAAESESAKAKISPNALRGGKVEEPEDDSDEEEDADTSGANWGKKARKRQRNFVKRVLSEEERRAKEIEDALDDDIKELLED